MRHALTLSLLLNAALASAAAFTGRIPPAARVPATSPIARLPISPLASLPGVALPAVSGSVNFPGKLPPLPVQLPVEVAAAAAPADAPSAAVHMAEGTFLAWELLDGQDDGLAGEFVPLAPGPRPMKPLGVMREMELAVEEPFELFDAARRMPLLGR